MTTHTTKIQLTLLVLLMAALPARGALDLTTAGGYGLSLGNSPRLRGLRINLRDHDVQRVDGINITLWRARPNKAAEYNGVLLGLWGPEGGRIRGVSAGLAGVSAADQLSGVALGLVGVASDRNATGLVLGGMGTGVGGDAAGIVAGGIGVGVGGRLRGDPAARAWDMSDAPVLAVPSSARNWRRDAVTAGSQSG